MCLTHWTHWTHPFSALLISSLPSRQTGIISTTAGHEAFLWHPSWSRITTATQQLSLFVSANLEALKGLKADHWPLHCPNRLILIIAYCHTWWRWTLATVVNTNAVHHTLHSSWLGREWKCIVSWKPQRVAFICKCRCQMQLWTGRQGQRESLWQALIYPLTLGDDKCKLLAD